MEGQGRLGDLVGELYDAVSGDAPLSSLAPKIAAAFSSKSCTLYVRNGFAGPIEQLSVTANFTPELMAGYMEYYYQHDVWADFGIRRFPGLLKGSDDLPMTPAEFGETMFYRDMARFTGAYYVLGAIIPLGEPEGAFSMFGIHRKQGEALFDAKEKRRGELFLPHLKRALQLREKMARLEIQQQAMFQSMERLALGVMLVSAQGGVLFANPVAESLLRQGNGVLMSQNRLHAASAAQDAQLQRLLHGAARAGVGGAAGAGGMLVLPRQNAAPLSLSIYPFTAPTLSNGARVSAALIFIADPDLQAPPRRDALARMYRLTGAEARLFEALLAGDRLQDYAERAALSLHTVKTQLSSLFQKTGHSRQTDLVREGLSNPILRLNEATNPTDV